MFSPHHRFEKCIALRRCIDQLFDSSCSTQEIRDTFYIHHQALEHKLKGAKYNLDKLIGLCESTSLADLSTGLSEFDFSANLYIDGFFYNGGSALDIFAREILALYDIHPTGDIYYLAARSEISSMYPSDPLLTRRNTPSWKNEFSNYRNASTHEVLLSTSISLSIQMTHPSQVQRISLPLPDDPRVVPSSRTFNRNPDAVEYCSKTFKRLLSHINIIYGDIANSALANGRLPLP